MSNNKSIFDEFTNLYALSKTLRFELKPTEETAELIKKNKIFEKDKTIDDSYNQAKFYFDELHRRFVKSALAEDRIKTINLENLAAAWKKEKENRKKYTEEQKHFYKEIKKLFDDKAEEWKKEYQKDQYKKAGVKFSKSDLKQKGVSFLLSAGVLGILKYEFPKEKENEFLKKEWPSLFVDEQENKGNKRYISIALTSFQLI